LSRKRAVLFDAVREMAGIDPKEIKSKNARLEPKSQLKGRLAKQNPRDSQAKPPPKGKNPHERHLHNTLDEDEDPEHDLAERINRNEVGVTKSWYHAGHAKPAKPSKPGQKPDDSEDESEEEDGYESATGQQSPWEMDKPGNELNHILETIKSALQDDPLAAPITSLKQAKSLETINWAASYIATVVTRQKSQLEELHGKVNVMESEKSAFESLKIQLTTELSALKQSYKVLEAEKRKFELAYEDARKQRETLERRSLKEHHEIQSALQRSENEKLLLSQDIQREQAEKKSLKAQYNNERVSLTSSHTRELEQIRNEHSRQIEEHHQSSKAREEEIKRLHKLALQRKESLYQAEMEKLNSLKEELTGELLKRDHFNSLRDRDVQVRFNALVDKVDLLARIEWSDRVSKSWPIQPRLLYGATNKREAKQYVLQDRLWRTLYFRVFCSPFRMLGEEGKALEQQWLVSSGISKSWVSLRDGANVGYRKQPIPS
jgi:hypothetical protein